MKQKVYMKIYILQENNLVSKLLKLTMDKEDHEVKQFTHSIDFYNAVTEHKPDLVIIDLLISYIAGYELISKIRKIPSTYIKIVVLSKVNSQMAVQEAFNLGVDEYIVSPFQVNTLIARINRLDKYTILSAKNNTLQIAKTDPALVHIS